MMIDRRMPEIVDEAHSLLRDMLNIQSQLIEKTKELPPADSAKIDQVPIKFWKVVSLNTTSFFVVIDSLCRVGKLDVALGLFKDMIMLDMVPNI